MDTKLITNYFSYAEFIYDDGSGPKDAKIKDVVAEMYDDEIEPVIRAILGDEFRLNDKGEKERVTPEEELLACLPDHIRLVRFY